MRVERDPFVAAMYSKACDEALSSPRWDDKPSDPKRTEMWVV